MENAASIYDYMGQRPLNSMFLDPVDDVEVLNTVKSCKPKHSYDCDGISMYVITKVIHQFVKPLVYIFYLSFSTGIFPNVMKTAKVIPLYKNGKKSDFSNYRPISLLSQISKILEKLFNVRLEHFLEANEILSSSQYGFRSRMSTVHAALEVIESISTAIDERQYCYGIFIDLKKAFDTVNHDILIIKLAFYGIRGISHKWLKVYLTNISQFVVVDSKTSSTKQLTCGVPQGSVLGPVLFLLYINDLCSVSNVLKLVLFADDTNIFYSSDSLHDLQTTVNAELSKLFAWFSVKKLSLNLTKTNYIFIPRVTVVKFLGIIIDEKLNWKTQIQSVKSKLASVLSVMHKASVKINIDGMYTLYCSLFHPYLSYCLEIWGNTYASNIKCIFTMQNKAIMLLCGADRLAHTNPLFKEMSILKLPDFVNYKTAIMMFNIFHRFLSTQLQNRFSVYLSAHSTRQYKTFIMSQVRTNQKAMCLSICGVKLWNALPDVLKNCNNIHAFKDCLKKYPMLSY